MKNKSLVMLLWIGCLSLAHAKDSVPLCPTPQLPNCVQSNWGQIGPDGTDEDIALPGTGSGPQTARARAASPRVSVELQTVATNMPSHSPALKAVLDANAMFVRETAALNSAILQARFDRNGKVVEGGPRIAAAAMAATEKAGDKYKLTIYIKQPPKQTDDGRRTLTVRIRSLNGILANPARYRDSGGKAAS